VKVGGTLLGGALDVLLHPTHVADYARQGMDIAGELATFALMPMDSPTALKGQPTGLKHAAWGRRIPLREFKAVAGGTGCSINDAVLSCVAGALRAYLQARGESVEEKEFRVLVPVNLRPADETSGMGNYFGLVALLLPLGIDNPLERLYEVRRRMVELKGSKQAAVSLGLLAAAGMVPNALQQSTLDLLASRASAVMTNLPGPGQPVRMAGAELKELIFWVPQSSTIGVGISVLSYAGSVQCGIVVDGNLANDPENIADRFRDEFDKLLWVTLLSPWGGKPEVAARKRSRDR
jgi:diacylglycerol O-acyltransferase / wax synthase